MKNKLLVLLSLIMIVFSTSAFAKVVEKLPVMRDGLYYEHFSTNIADGTYETYHTNGQLRYKGFYKSGIRDGVHMGYNDDGTIFRRTTYKDGIKNGVFLHPYGAGSFQVGIYKDGKKDGITENYKEDGTLSYKCIYQNGNKYECEYF